MRLEEVYREVEALGGAVVMDDYDEGYSDGLDEALAVLRRYGFGVDLAPGSEWQPIGTAPKDWTEILLFDPDEDDNGGVSQGYYSMRDGGQDRWVSHYFRSCAPTRWMPMPQPPKQRRET